MSEREHWQLTGNAPEIYATYLVPAIFGPWVPVMLDLAEVEVGQTLLDVACGTGVIAAGAAQRVAPSGSVIGVDNNPGMLAVASRSKNDVRWQEADAQALPFPDHSFDRVICQLGLQYFPDRHAALREMYRVLRPDGRAVLLVWRDICHSPGFAALAKALESSVGPAAAEVMRAPFVFGDDPAPILALLQQAGLADVRIEARTGAVEFASTNLFLRAQIGGSPLATHVDVQDDALLGELAAAVARALGAASTQEALRFPIEAHVIRAMRSAASREPHPTGTFPGELPDPGR